jgi:3',5'-cyclic AMP phosphodiesterase CpdA
MRLYAISDVHLGHEVNRRAFEALSTHPNDWLILGGDMCESLEDLEHAARVATTRFARVVWVPGNHELWTLPPATERGEARYLACVRRC